MRVDRGTITHSFTSPKGENLVAAYRTFSITVEPSPDPDPRPSGRVAFSYTWPAAVATHAGHLLARFADNPQQKGIAVGLREQVKLAQLHFNLALNEVKKENLAGARLHAEHIVNIIEGSKGPNYGDLDGNGRVENPGDGLGVLVYVARAAQHANLMRTPLPNDPVVQLHTRHIIDSSDNVTAWATEARDEALKALKRTDITLLAFDMQFGLREITRALEGFDANGNRVVEPIPGEGGTSIVYEHSALAATFTLQQPPTPTPVPAPTPVLPRAGDVNPGPWLPMVLLVSLGLLVAGVVLLRWRPRKA